MIKGIKKVLSVMLSGVVLMGGMLPAGNVAFAQEEPPIRLYNETPGAVTSKDFSVSVDGIDVPVEQVYDIGLARFVYLQNRDVITVTVKARTAVECVDIYPHSREIPATLDTANRSVTFSLTREQIGQSLKLIVGLNNDAGKELVLLIDTPQPDAPQLGQAGVKSVLDYAGVRGDGTLCTAALQAAIDAAGDDPAVSVLYFPAGTYLTGRLVISKDNTQIYLADGALIKGSDDLKDYPNGDTGFGHHDRRNGSVFIHVLGTAEQPVKNVRLFGHGVIDGSGMELEAKWHSQNLDNQENWIHLFEGKYVDGLVVEDITMRNSSNWGCKIENANHVTMNRVNVLNPFDKIWSDGIDISSSENCVYNDSLSYSHDDAIAIMTLQLQENGKEIGDLPGKTSNITFNNHLGRSACSGVRFGWDSSDRIENLQFNNCEFALALHGGMNFHRLKNNNAFGKITFTDCRWDRADVTSVGRFITCFDNQYQFAPIKAEGLEFIGCVIEGMPATVDLNGNAIDNVLFDSVQITSGTGSTLLRRASDIPKLSVSGTVGMTFADSYGLGKHAQSGRFEAEAMMLSQVQISTNATGFDGFGFVKGFQQANANLKLPFTADISASYPLSIRYQAPSGAVDNMALYVDGQRVSKLSFAATDSAWETVDTTLSLAKGEHTVELRSETKGRAPLYVDWFSLTVPNKFEAEDAAVEGGQIDADGAAVELSKIGATVRFAAIPSAKQIAVKYRAAFDTDATLIVGGAEYPLDLYETGDTMRMAFVDVADFVGGEVSIVKSGHGAVFSVDGIYAMDEKESDGTTEQKPLDGVNLAIGRPLTLTPAAMVYGNKEAAFDGNVASFFDCGSANFPSALTVDLETVYRLDTVVMKLPENWGDRHQEISMEISVDGQTFTELVARKSFAFNQKDRNVVMVSVNGMARYFRITGYSNDEVDRPGFQLGELELYGRYPASAESVRLDAEEATLAPGGTLSLTATVLPENQCSADVAWSSSDVSVAVVNHDGQVTAIAPGTCTIRVRTVDGNHMSTLRLTVGEETVTLLGDVNGDGKVDSGDALQLLRYAAEIITENDLNLSVADLNGDGKVDSGDALLSLQYAAEIITEFPAGDK